MILGLDLASTTGYAYSDDVGGIQSSGSISFKGSPGDKFNLLFSWLENEVLSNRPTVIVFEKPHFRGSSATMLCVGFAAIVQMIASKYNIQIIGVASRTVKAFATNNRDADKAEMTVAATQATGKHLDVKMDNDQADAIHIARWAAQALQNPEELINKKKSKKSK